MAKDILVSTVISRHHYLTLLIFTNYVILYVIVDFEMAIAVLATIKIYEFLLVINSNSGPNLHRF